jgi:hypothetical protein
MFLKIQEKDSYGKFYYNLTNKIERISASIEDAHEEYGENCDDPDYFVDAAESLLYRETALVNPGFFSKLREVKDDEEEILEVDALLFTTMCGSNHKVFIPKHLKAYVCDDSGKIIDRI